MGATGTQAFLTTPPFAGLSITTQAAFTTQADLAAPEPCSIDVRRMTPDGSYPTLHILTHETYPPENAGGPPPHMMETISPLVSSVLAEVYPRGLP